MRRRLLLSIVAVSVAAIAVLGVPLALLLGRLAHQEAHARLDRQAQSLLLAVEAQLQAGRSVSVQDLLELVPEGDHLLVTAGATSVPLGAPITGDRLEASAVAPSGLKVTLTTSGGPVTERVRRAVLVLVGFGVVGVASAGLLGVVLARRLSTPLDELAAVAARLGDGDFSVPAPRSGLAEVDAIAEAMDRSSRRIAELVQAERAFSSNASHQLRSALTGLRLRLEELAAHPDADVRVEATAALGQATRLSDTIGDLLVLARTGRAGRAGRFDLAALVALHVEDWRPPLTREHRRVVLRSPGPVWVQATAGAVGQALDVVLANAARHGAGTVEVTITVGSGRVDVLVTDQGPGIDPAVATSLFERLPGPDGHGIGLALARTLLEAEGGRLELVAARPARFALRLPVASDPWPPPTPVPELGQDGGPPPFAVGDG